MDRVTRKGSASPPRARGTCLGIALVLVGLASPQIARAEAALDEARAAYERGVEHERAGELEEALAAYQRAQEIRPAYRLHRHMGRVLQALNRHAEAIEHYRAFLLEGGDNIDVTRRGQVQSAIAASSEHVARLTIDAPEGATIEIDGVPVGRAPLAGPVLIDEGARMLEVSLEGYRTHRRSLTAVGGSEPTIEIELEPLSSAVEAEPSPEESAPAAERGPRRVSPAWFWAGLGVSVATLGAGVAMGILALSEQAEFDGLNWPERNDAEDELLMQYADRGRTYSLAADVLIFTGAAFAAATVVLAFFTDFGRRRGRGDEADVALVPLAARGGVGLGVVGGF